MKRPADCKLERVSYDVQHIFIICSRIRHNNVLLLYSLKIPEFNLLPGLIHKPHGPFVGGHADKGFLSYGVGKTSSIYCSIFEVRKCVMNSNCMYLYSLQLMDPLLTKVLLLFSALCQIVSMPYQHYCTHLSGSIHTFLSYQEIW